MQVKEDKASTDGENHGDVTKLFYQNSKKGPKQIQVPSPQELQLQIMEVDEERHKEGYDLDGNIGPYWETVRKEGQQLYDNNNNDDDTVVREKLLVDAPPPPISPLIRPPLPATTTTVGIAAATTIETDTDTGTNDIIVLPVHDAIYCC